MKGFGLLALLAGAGALLMMSHEGSTAPAVPAPPGPGGTPPPKPTGPQPPLPQVPPLPGLDNTLGCPVESNIPPFIAAIWEQVRQNADPVLMRQAADQIELAGYPLLAGCIRQQADKVGGTPA